MRSLSVKISMHAHSGVALWRHAQMLQEHKMWPSIPPKQKEVDRKE
jgi:hypothetical protein